MEYAASPIWSPEQLEKDSKRSERAFKQERLDEETRWGRFYDAAYKAAFAQAAHILEASSNLREISTAADDILSADYLDALRYMTRPAISEDDLKTRAELKLASHGVREEDRPRAIELITRNLNADIFPWIESGEAPSASSRDAACGAVAALLAEQKTKTAIRKDASKKQEELVRATLVEQCGLKLVPGAAFSMQKQAPEPGEILDREVKAGDKKADVVIGLFDGRFMCVECKVSNTAVNSFKRLNHETVEKAQYWRQQFGAMCVTGAVLSGCYSTPNLQAAQEAGVALFWTFDLAPLVEFVKRTGA